MGGGGAAKHRITPLGRHVQHSQYGFIVLSRHVIWTAGWNWACCSSTDRQALADSGRVCTSTQVRGGGATSGRPWRRSVDAGGRWFACGCGSERHLLDGRAAQCRAEQRVYGYGRRIGRCDDSTHTGRDGA